MVELHFGLFKHFLHFSLLTEETIRLACPSSEQQTLKYLIFHSLSFTFAKEQSTSKVNTSFYLLWIRFELAGFSCFCPSHQCLKGLRTEVWSEWSSESRSFLITQQCLQKESFPQAHGLGKPALRCKADFLLVPLTPGNITFLPCRNPYNNMKNIPPSKKSNTEYFKQNEIH